MKKLYISFPSKTFLIGEYAVLHSAPAILVNTTPLFEFLLIPKTEQAQKWIQNCEQLLKESVKISQTLNVKNNDSFYKNIHPASPAGQWLKTHPEIKGHWHIESYDPHKRQGGFGLSSAQFNLMYWLSQIDLTNNSVKNVESYELWKSYKELNFDGHTPSSADVISQWMGQVCLFSGQPFKAQSISWPFDDLDFLLIRTGVQLNTWKYLKSISTKQLEITELTNISQQATNSLNNQNTKSFVSSIEEYGICLEKQNLVYKNTLMLLKKIKKIKYILTTKGCGAMGAEVIALFYHPQYKEQIKSDLKNSFTDQAIIADSSSITSGLQIHTV